MIKSKMKIILKINYLLSRKIIIHTSMVINEKMGGSEGRERERVKAERERVKAQRERGWPFFLFLF